MVPSEQPEVVLQISAKVKLMSDSVRLLPDVGEKEDVALING